MKKALVLVLTVIMVFGVTIPAFAAEQTTIEDLANSVALNPIKTGCSELDAEVDKVLSGIISNNMTPYEKLVAVYNYCVLNFTYDYRNAAISLKAVHAVSIEGKPLLDEIANYEALTVLKNKIGVCDHYAAAFTVLANAVGFESHYLTGRLTWNSGASNGHSWSVIAFGQTYYIFDPQAEQYNMRNGKVRYINFGKVTLYSSRYSAFSNVLESSLARRKNILSK